MTSEDDDGLQIGKRLRETLSLVLRASPTTLVIGFCGAVALEGPSIVTAGSDPAAPDVATDFPVLLVAGVVGILLSNLAMAMQLMAADDALHGHAAGPGAYLRPALRRLWPLLRVVLVGGGAALLAAGVLMVLVFVVSKATEGPILVIPGTILVFALVFAATIAFMPLLTVVVFEGLGLKAFARSLALTKGHRGSLAGLFLLACFLSFMAIVVPVLLVVIVFGRPTAVLAVPGIQHALNIAYGTLGACFSTAFMVSIHRRLVALEGAPGPFPVRQPPSPPVG
ncbi:hypothetical protein [Aurantimonas sp. Leaf443]|uniref:hypothetical protein n=1 Tax=Aurantimonas sp. Leaf443 TaxID=1736378 RepID=UPI0006F2CF95|nr:hypothetical protein [Aurantimonas sp. Leaf443]KQT88487.1 hypothetical protein ASG48_03510 [Aurantimonas sp. Leaf443]